MIQKKNLYAPFWYTALSLFTLLFGMVYTSYGYGAHSDYMTYAFVPLQIAAFAYFLLAFWDKIPRPGTFSSLFFAFSIASFTLDRITQGILEIAGAYSNYDVLIKYTAHATHIIAIALYAVEIILLSIQKNNK